MVPIEGDLYPTDSLPHSYHATIVLIEQIIYRMIGKNQKRIFVVFTSFLIVSLFSILNQVLPRIDSEGRADDLILNGPTINVNTSDI